MAASKVLGEEGVATGTAAGTGTGTAAASGTGNVRNGGDREGGENE